MIAAAILVRGGVALATAGDQLAERTGWGRLFVGTLFLAFATSLPEVVTDMTAAAAGAPDLAVGDLFGSSMANMAILAIIDLRHRGRVWPSVELGHARVAAVGIVLTALAALGVHTPSAARIGWVGVTPIMIMAVYVASLVWLRRSPVLPRVGIVEVVPDLPQGGGSDRKGMPPMRAIATRFGLAAGLILVSAPVVAITTRDMASATGVDQTFLGAALLAITTSLPELVVSLAAVRIGAYDLAVGNLFGSNATNMSVLLFADLAYTDGSILAAVKSTQVVTALGAIVLMGLAVAAIVGGTETRIRRLEPDAILVLIAYVGALAAVAVTG